MFNKLKQFKDMRDQAKSLQSMLAEEKVTVEKNGLSITMDGNQKLLSIKIPESLSNSELEKMIPDLFNEAVKKVHRVIATKMQQSGMGLPGMQ